MWKFRYRREYLTDWELVDRCNALGEEGWSLLGPPVWVPGDAEEQSEGIWRCFFRRTISNREQLKEAFSLSPKEARP